MTGRPTEIGVLLAPAGDSHLMLPAGMVAEIVALQRLEAAPDGAPDWLLGHIQWRGRSVPVVRLATARDPESGRPPRAHLVVCFTPNGNASIPYLAIETRGLPRLERVTATALTPDENPHAFALAALQLNGKAAWLPDLDAVEAALSQAGLV